MYYFVRPVTGPGTHDTEARCASPAGAGLGRSGDAVAVGGGEAVEREHLERLVGPLGEMALDGHAVADVRDAGRVVLQLQHGNVLAPATDVAAEAVAGPDLGLFIAAAEQAQSHR